MQPVQIPKLISKFQKKDPFKRSFRMEIGLSVCVRGLYLGFLSKGNLTKGVLSKDSLPNESLPNTGVNLERIIWSQWKDFNALKRNRFMN